MSIRIELLDTPTAEVSDLEALHELYVEWDSERIPTQPETPFEQRLAQWRFLRSFEDIPRWVARDATRVVGTAGVYHNRTQDLDNAWGWVFVSEERRGEGIGRELARHSVGYSLSDGRKRFAVGVDRESSFHDVPQRAGMKPVYNERISHLRTARIDRELMRSWIERASERADGYDILFLPMPIPDEHRARMVEVMHVMNTAPTEEMEEDPMVWTEDLLRDVEEMEMQRQRSIHTCVARHVATGDFVGYTSLVYQKLHPRLAYQWDTGVDPAHRNLGLGRWLKAAMAERFLDEHPEVEVIQTENAESNDPMLNINVAMGFEPALDEIVYQGEIERVAEYIGI